MNTFSIKFKTVCMELDLIVTSSENASRFKIEMVTGEPNPMVLKRSENGKWDVIQSGGRTILKQRYEEIGTSIDNYFKSMAH